MQILSIAVFCGSKPGKNELFAQHAHVLGEILAQHRITVIYGGGKRGLMGTIADGALSKQGKVIGIIPKLLVDTEHQHDEITELQIVETMHIRKQLLYENCDAAIILPGGFGTLDEVFEMLTWNQLDIHNKKIFFLNSGGFYDHLIAHIQHLEDEGFLYGSFSEKATVISTPEEIIPFVS